MSKVEYVCNPKLIKRFKYEQNRRRNSINVSFIFLIAKHEKNWRKNAVSSILIQFLRFTAQLSPIFSRFARRDSEFQVCLHFSVRFADNFVCFRRRRIQTRNRHRLLRSRRLFQCKFRSSFSLAKSEFVRLKEYPGYSMGYIKGSSKLLLCQVLQGKVSWIDSTMILNLCVFLLIRIQVYQCTQLIQGADLQDVSWVSWIYFQCDKKSSFLRVSIHIVRRVKKK